MRDWQVEIAKIEAVAKNSHNRPILAYVMQDTANFFRKSIARLLTLVSAARSLLLSAQRVQNDPAGSRRPACWAVTHNPLSF